MCVLRTPTGWSKVTKVEILMRWQRSGHLGSGLIFAILSVHERFSFKGAHECRWLVGRWHYCCLTKLFCHWWCPSELWGWCAFFLSLSFAFSLFIILWNTPFQLEKGVNNSVTFFFFFEINPRVWMNKRTTLKEGKKKYLRNIQRWYLTTHPSISGKLQNTLDFFF